jgi:hypothetical protein
MSGILQAVFVAAQAAALPFKSIQRGTSYGGTAVTITAVDTTKSIINPTGYDSTTSGIPYGFYTFFSSTEIRFPSNASGKTFGWEVIEFN